MPGLISSAAPGRKAAPKAPARRRPAPSIPALVSATPAPSSVASAPPPSPPTAESPGNRQPGPSDVHSPPLQDARTLPADAARSEPAYERELELARVELGVPEFTAESAVEPVRGKENLPNSKPTEDRVGPQKKATEAPEQATLSREEDVQDTALVDNNAAPEHATSTAALENDEQQVSVDHDLGTETRKQAENNTQSTKSTSHARVSRSSAKRVRIDAAPTTASHPAKRAKRSSARSNATVQAVAQSEETAPSRARKMPTDTVTSRDVAQAQGVPKRRQPPRKATTSQRKRKGRGKPKSVATVVNSDDEAESAPSLEPSQEDVTRLGAAREDAESVRSTPKKVRRKRKPAKSRRADTPETEDGQQQSGEEDLENHQIDPGTLSMWDLSHNTRYGKTSELGRKLAEIPWDEIVQQRRAAANLIMTGQQESNGEVVVESVERPDGAANRSPGKTATEEHAATKAASEVAEDQPTIVGEIDNGDNDSVDGNAPLIFDEEGNITINPESMIIDRGAAADAAMNSGKPIEEVNDLTVQINRTTWMNDSRRDPTDRVPAWKWKSDPWSEDETDRFYEALRMFGTDFFIISKMFPPKTRRMIKAKFNREERLDPQRINDALSGKFTKPMNLEHYSQQTGRDVSVYTQYESYEHAQSVISESMKDKQDAMTSAVQQDAAAAEERAQKEKQQKKEKGKSRRQTRKARVRGGGTMGGGPDEATDA